MAVENKQTFDKEFPIYLDTHKHLFPLHQKMPEIEFINGNFLDHEWTDVSVLYMNSYFYALEITDEVFKRAHMIPQGSFFINTSHSFTERFAYKWDSLRPFRRNTSFIPIKYYIHRKKPRLEPTTL
jgi:hypothetical protein